MLKFIVLSGKDVNIMNQGVGKESVICDLALYYGSMRR